MVEKLVYDPTEDRKHKAGSPLDSKTVLEKIDKAMVRIKGNNNPKPEAKAKKLQKHRCQHLKRYKLQHGNGSPGEFRTLAKLI